MHSYNLLILATQLMAIVALNAQQKHPNIIYLMSDDQSIYSMGCYGNIDVQTPNLDRLSADGITFETAFCEVDPVHHLWGGTRSAEC